MRYIPARLDLFSIERQTGPSVGRYFRSPKTNVFSRTRARARARIHRPKFRSRRITALVHDRRSGLDIYLGLAEDLKRNAHTRGYAIHGGALMLLADRIYEKRESVPLTGASYLIESAQRRSARDTRAVHYRSLSRSCFTRSSARGVDEVPL